MEGANAVESRVPMDPRQDLIIDGEQLIPGTRAAMRGVVSGIFLQGEDRPWVDVLEDEDVQMIRLIMMRRRYRRAMVRNFLPYVDRGHGEEIAERLRVAEGRVAEDRPATAPQAEVGQQLEAPERPKTAPEPGK